MSYRNAAEILPTHLLKEVQKYIEGGLIYIPKQSDKIGWGYISGTRHLLDKRNNRILKLYKDGSSINELAQAFYLSEETIKKIVYGKKEG